MKTKLSTVNYQLSILLILAAFLSPLTMQADTAAQLQTTINAFTGGSTGKLTATVSGNTVTVTGSLMAVTQTLNLNINSNVTVEWKATLAGNAGILIGLTGYGMFQVADGANIQALADNTVCIRTTDASVIYVAGGTVSATKTNAIQAIGTGALITVNGGTVGSTTGDAIFAPDSNCAITLSGTGIVRSTDGGDGIIIDGAAARLEVKDNAQVSATTNQAIRATGLNPVITISGGTVTNTNGRTLYATGSATGAKITISGTGKVQATNNTALATVETSGVSVDVKDQAQILATAQTGICAWSNNIAVTVGGTATVSSNTGLAIAAGGSGATVTVSGGTVKSNTANAIEVTGANAKTIVSGGTVSSSGGYSINATGAAAAITVSGGTINNCVYVKGDNSVMTVSGGTITAGAAQYDAIDFECTNSTLTVSGGTINGGTYDAIYVYYTTSKVTVSGTGKVQRTTASINYTIYSAGNVEVKDNATVTAADGIIAIYGSGASVTVSGGTVSATTGRAIYATNTASIVTVSGGTVSATTGNAIYTAGATSVVTISGGVVSATTGNTIYTAGGSAITRVSGGTVRATTGVAINSNGSGATIQVSGGVVFAFGSAVTGDGNVIYTQNSSSAFAGVTGVGMVIAWNQAAGKTTYMQSTSDDIIWLPASATATWDINGSSRGISYKNGTNSGFIGVYGVTVNALPQTYLNLSVAVQGETNAVAHYTAFASKAEDEGYPVIALLFRATADAEAKHADDEWNILVKMGAKDRPVADTPVVGTTAENLQAALDGETYEYTTMYPGFLAEAQAESQTEAANIFRLAGQAEHVHANNYSDVESHLVANNLAYINSTYATLYRCPVCGEVVTALPTQCPICGTSGSSYIKYVKTGIETVEAPSVVVYSQSGNLIVESKTLTIKSVSVYAVSGQLLKTVESGKAQVSIPLFISPSILIVKIVMSDGAIVTKKIVF